MMPTFQEQLDIDIDNVFLNADAKEFVTLHKIGGTRGKPPFICAIVTDRDLYKERNKHRDGIENITVDGLVIFIKKAVWVTHFIDIPPVDSVLVFDDKKYQIESVDDDMGVLEITLRGARGRVAKG